MAVHLVRLPASDGGTSCSVTVHHRGPRHIPVAVITDSATNPGLSAHLVLDALTSRLREQLPPNSEEPIWVLRWPEPAIASVLLADVPILTHHLLVRDRLGWRLTPLPAAVVEELLSPPSLELRDLRRARPADHDREVGGCSQPS